MNEQRECQKRMFGELLNWQDFTLYLLLNQLEVGLRVIHRSNIGKIFIS